MTVGGLYRPILVGNPPIVAGGLQPIVLTQILIELGQLLMVTPRIAVGGTQAIGAFALAERSSVVGALHHRPQTHSATLLITRQSFPRLR